MALKIEQECDLSGKRVSVSLPTSGPLDLSNIPLPKGWERRPAFPGGKVGDPSGMTLCEQAIPLYDQALIEADDARDQVYARSMSKAKAQICGTAQPGQAVPRATSSFAGARR